MNHEDLEIMLDKELEEMILLEAIENNIDNEKQALPNKKKRKKFASKKIKEALKIRTVIILLLTLIVNTYAWFIYISTVSTGLNIHVKSWEFEFSMDDKIDDVVLFAEELYPGMNEVKQTITATNKGETEANLSYTITSIKIFGEDILEGKDSVDAEGFKELLKDYPFDIQIKMVSKDGIEFDVNNPMQKGDEVQIEFTLNWEYQRGEDTNTVEENDVKDTDIGKKAYDYYNKLNGTEEGEDPGDTSKMSAIEIIVHIEATQSKPNE